MYMFCLYDPDSGDLVSTRSVERPCEEDYSYKQYAMKLHDHGYVVKVYDTEDDALVYTLGI